MPLNDVLVKLRIDVNKEEKMKEREKKTNIEEAFRKVSEYFGSIVATGTYEGDTPAYRNEIIKTLGILEKYLREVSEEGSKPPLELEAEKIRHFWNGVGGENPVSSKDALKILVEYFGKPKKQEEDYSPKEQFGKPVFEELEFLQEKLGNIDWAFGREGAIILEGQLAFLKREGDLVQAAVYRPYKNEIGDEASIQMFEYNVKDFKP